jgi:predicted O-methyltransferase YrrM
MRPLERIFLRRPRILNVLHQLRLASPTSQTIEGELQSLEQYAKEARLAVEIGSSQGVSAARIAGVLAEGGKFYCIDPWPAPNGKINPCYSIFYRHLRRARRFDKVHVLQTVSGEAGELVPDEVDFIFVDGDHSWQGVETDWNLVRRKLRVGGIVCLHDSLTPPKEPWRRPESVQFYQQVVAADPEFRTIDGVHSLAVLRRLDRTSIARPESC